MPLNSEARYSRYKEKLLESLTWEIRSSLMRGAYRNVKYGHLMS